MSDPCKVRVVFDEPFAPDTNPVIDIRVWDTDSAKALAAALRAGTFTVTVVREQEVEVEP